MPKKQDWRDIIASSLGWEQAHTNLESAAHNLAPNLRGKRPDGLPHSPWELLEHIRITHHDLVDFCTNPDYEEKLEWPRDYWPAKPEPPNSEAWEKSIAEFQHDRDELANFTTETDIDLTGKIPRGTGQTYLRTVILAVDHAAYHIGQLILVRRLLGAWPAK